MTSMIVQQQQRLQQQQQHGGRSLLRRTTTVFRINNAQSFKNYTQKVQTRIGRRRGEIGKTRDAKSTETKTTEDDDDDDVDREEQGLDMNIEIDEEMLEELIVEIEKNNNNNQRDGSKSSSFSGNSSTLPRKKTAREIEAHNVMDVHGFHSPWSLYESRIDTDDDDDSTPWEDHLKEVMAKKDNWPCWDFSKPEEYYEPEPEFVSFQQPPAKFNAFEERAVLFKRKVKKEQEEMTKKREEEIKKFRYMSQDDDIRLRNKATVDETEWDHDKIVDLINFDPKERAEMMKHSVDVYDPRFIAQSIPDPNAESYEDTLTFLYRIGRLCVDDEWEDRKWIEMTGEPTPEFDEEEEVDPDDEDEDTERSTELDAMTYEKLARVKDIGFDDDDGDFADEEQD